MNQRRPALPPELIQVWQRDLDDHIVALACSPCGAFIAAASIAGPILVLDTASGDVRASLPGHGPGTLSLSWQPGAAVLASAGQDGRVRLWDVSSAALLISLDAGAAWAEHVAFSHDGHLLASAAGRKLRLWEPSGSLLLAFPDHPSTITDIQWQPGAQILSSACYGQVATFRPTQPQPLNTFSWKGSILRLRWSPNANALATGNQDASVHFWYRKSGKDLEMSGYANKVRELAWDPSSRFLATGGGPVAIVWDCSGKGPAGSRPIQLTAHSQPLSALAFQHRGPLLASSCAQGLVCLWNPAQGQQLLQAAIASGPVTCLDWTPCDQALAVSTAQGQLLLLAPAA